MKMTPFPFFASAAAILVTAGLLSCEQRAEAADDDKLVEVIEAKAEAAKKIPAGTTSKDKKVLKKVLTPLQYDVAVESGTERSFSNEYWDNKKPGIYVDIVSGKPLFASTHKYKSGTGWPSFFQPIDAEEIVEVVDRKFGSVRTEVRSKTADIHLGHVFDDGPQPTGLRYCMNSAAMRFVPKEKLKEEGLEKYAKLLEKGGEKEDKE